MTKVSEARLGQTREGAKRSEEAKAAQRRPPGYEINKSCSPKYARVLLVCADSADYQTISE